MCCTLYADSIEKASTHIILITKSIYRYTISKKKILRTSYSITCRFCEKNILDYHWTKAHSFKDNGKSFAFYNGSICRKPNATFELNCHQSAKCVCYSFLVWDIAHEDHM